MTDPGPPEADGPPDLDACMCGAAVPAHSSSDLLTPDGRRLVERGSCRSCGLQLVRTVGEPWRHIRG